MSKSSNALDAILNFSPTTSKPEKRPKKLKNLLIDEELAMRFEALCRLENTTFTAKLVAFMTDETENNIGIIDSMLNLRKS